MRWWLVLPWILAVACAEGASATPANRSGARAEDVQGSDDETGEDQGGVEVVDASTPRRTSSGNSQSSDAGQARAPAAGGSRATPARDAGSIESRSKDSGLAADAGAPDSGDANASEPEPEPETKPANTGSCCSAGTGTGCGDSALQACVCALSPRCCSEAWDESCARLVKEKNCQAGVRDCVCGSGEGQWEQAYCCEGGWNATCESVSIHKCGATEACP
jgi:hypothetical protein